MLPQTVTESPATPSAVPSEAATKAGTRKRGGAPRGNANAARHGLKSSKLPPGTRHEEAALYAFRSFTRDALVAIHGEVGLLHEALLQSAVRHETRALLAARWLRKEGDKMPLSDRLALLATVCSASDARDKALRACGLERSAGAPDSMPPWASLLNAPQPVPSPKSTNEPATLQASASESTRDDSEVPAHE